jgi:hypothetical protein
MDPELPGILSVSRKHHFWREGLLRFARVTVARMDGSQPSNCAIPVPLFVLNGFATSRLSKEDLAVMDSARLGIRDAEQELDWRGRSHFLIQVLGLLVDGIDAEAARIAAAEATKELIMMQDQYPD